MTDEQLLMAFANNHRGDLNALLLSFFKFLHERTDLYVVDDNPQQMGFKPGHAEAKVIQAFRALPYKVRPSKTQGPGSQTAPAAIAKAKSNKAEPKPTEVVAPEHVRKVDSTAPREDKTLGNTGAGSYRIGTVTLDRANGSTEGAKQTPVDNGGRGPGYVWTQSLKEMIVHIKVPKGTRGKDLDCSLTSGNLTVKLKGIEGPLLVGEYPLSEMIDVGESSWSLNDETLILMLMKRRETWWPSVIRGHPEIDTSKVDSVKRISDYDPETEAAIRKLLVEQQQEQSLYTG